MWIARDADGIYKGFYIKPKRYRHVLDSDDSGYWKSEGMDYLMVMSDFMVSILREKGGLTFPSSFKDEPIEISAVFKPL